MNQTMGSHLILVYST